MTGPGTESSVALPMRSPTRLTRTRRLALALVAVVVVAASLCVAGPFGRPLVAGAAAGSTGGSTVIAPCGTTAPAGYSVCLDRIVKPQVAAPAIASSASASTTLPLSDWPNALYPADITAAYGWQSSDHTTGEGETIALVDAYDDPTIVSNLKTFSSEFGLPTCTKTGCFTKVNQTGGTTRYPQKSATWDTEISLDVEWAHAMAPKAKLLLVEATSDSDTNLFTAVAYAAAHAQYVSMSWGGTEFSGETSYDSTFTAHATTVSFFAATGDTAEKVEYPSASPKVIAVGGTKLEVTKTNETWEGESGWKDGGGGCSKYEQATPAQEYFPDYSQSGVTCGTARGTPDVAADATPTTGVAVYDTVPVRTGQETLSGWFQVGGTSLATPLWAAHSAADGIHVTQTYVYGRKIPFYKITTGGNGRDCVQGYNLCAGLGSWSTLHGALNPAAFNATGIGTGTATVTLAYDATTTTLTPVTTPVTEGSEHQSFSGRVAGTTGDGYPTGKVTIVADSTSATTAVAVAACTATAAGGSTSEASFSCSYSSVTVLSAGSYTVHAHFTGGKSSTPHYVYRASSSAAQTLTVNS